MTRVLQIRRGTTTQNDNFTGMPGEITMDTDKNTIRIHDGQTLGGFEFARTGNSFDINTVTAEQWEQIIAQYQQPELRLMETDLMAIHSQTAGITYNTTNTEKPKFANAVLVCVNPEAGYNPDDEVNEFGVGDKNAPKINYEPQDFGYSLQFLTGYENYWVRNKQTGEVTIISDENWKILFRVYY